MSNPIQTELLSSTAPAPAEVRGHNRPPSLLSADDLIESFGKPYRPAKDGQPEQEEQPGKYLDLQKEVDRLLATIGGRIEGIPAIPTVIETDADNGRIAEAMEDLRRTHKNIETARTAEKAPYLAAERAIDNYHGAMRERIEKTRDILQKRGDIYTAKKAEEARAQRALEARRAAEEAARIAAAEQEERKRQEEAAAAAERARKPENIAAHTATAETARTNAAMFEVDKMQAISAAENALASAKAGTASIVRTRHESGHMSTGKDVGYVEIEDIDQIPLDVIRAFLKPEHIESAVKAWAKQQDYKKPLAGCKIGKRAKADYR